MLNFKLLGKLAIAAPVMIVSEQNLLKKLKNQQMTSPECVACCIKQGAACGLKTPACPEGQRPDGWKTLDDIPTKEAPKDGSRKSVDEHNKYVRPVELRKANSALCNAKCDRCKDM